MKYSLRELDVVRVAACTPELRVADVEFNTNEILKVWSALQESCVGITVFPELSLCGYTCGDLLYQTALLRACEESVAAIAEKTIDDNGILVVGAPIAFKGELFNCAVVINNGNIVGIVPKTFLPNYNEFYEMRWFRSGKHIIQQEIVFANQRVPFGIDILFSHIPTPLSNATRFSFAVEICEDVWAAKTPSTDATLAGAQLVLNLSASPEIVGKSEIRKQLIATHSGKTMSAYVYASAGVNESSTDLVFGGHSFIYENGMLLGETPRFEFESSWCIADVDVQRLESERCKNSTFGAEESSVEFREVRINMKDVEVETLERIVQPHPFVPNSPHMRSVRCNEIFELQSTALAKRLKHIGCSNVVLGLSGGLDSTLALLVCIKAFEKLQLPTSGIHAITMPGFGTTQRTKTNADNLAALLGVSYSEISIHKAVEQHFSDLQHDPANHNILFENAQARERTQILMDYCHKVNGIVVGTGDLSEIALGWSTYNGDHMSMYAVNSGVPKTLVRYIIEWYASDSKNEQIKTTLLDIASTPVSPELLPANEDGTIAQVTEDHVGPYELHDFFLYHVVRLQQHPKKVLTFASVAFGDKYKVEEIKNWLNVFYKRFFSQQFKRSCMPDGPKIGSVALSPRGDWRMPSDAQSALWLKELENI